MLPVGLAQLIVGASKARQGYHAAKGAFNSFQRYQQKQQKAATKKAQDNIARPKTLRASKPKSPSKPNTEQIAALREKTQNKFKDLTPTIAMASKAKIATPTTFNPVRSRGNKISTTKKIKKLHPTPPPSNVFRKPTANEVKNEILGPDYYGFWK